MHSTFFYLRDQDERPFGVLHLIYDPSSNTTSIGASVCHENDEWVRVRGREIAECRAKGDLAVTLLPHETPSLEAVFANCRFPLKDWNGHAKKNSQGNHLYTTGMPHRYKSLSLKMEKTFQTALRKVRPRQ